MPIWAQSQGLGASPGPGAWRLGAAHRLDRLAAVVTQCGMVQRLCPRPLSPMLLLHIAKIFPGCNCLQTSHFPFPIAAANRCVLVPLSVSHPSSSRWWLAHISPKISERASLFLPEDSLQAISAPSSCISPPSPPAWGPSSALENGRRQFSDSSPCSHSTASS